jgi:hypothetical protein
MKKTLRLSLLLLMLSSTASFSIDIPRQVYGLRNLTTQSQLTTLSGNEENFLMKVSFHFQDSVPGYMFQPRWRLLMVAQDLIRLDSVTMEFYFIQKLLVQEKRISKARSDQNKFYLLRIKEKDVQITSLNQDLLLADRRSIYWESIARTYKRQRNGVVIVSGVVIVGVGILTYAILKR